jgi:hypothetical protein
MGRHLGAELACWCHQEDLSGGRWHPLTGISERQEGEQGKTEPDDKRQHCLPRPLTNLPRWQQVPQQVARLLSHDTVAFLCVSVSLAQHCAQTSQEA